MSTWVWPGCPEEHVCIAGVTVTHRGNRGAPVNTERLKAEPSARRSLRGLDNELGQKHEPREQSVPRTLSHGAPDEGQATDFYFGGRE